MADTDRTQRNVQYDTERDTPQESQHETQQDPVIFGSDPFTHERPPVEDDDLVTYRPPTRWPFVVAILILVVVLVGALGLWVF